MQLILSYTLLCEQIQSQPYCEVSFDLIMRCMWQIKCGSAVMRLEEEDFVLWYGEVLWPSREVGMIGIVWNLTRSANIANRWNIWIYIRQQGDHGRFQKLGHCLNGGVLYQPSCHSCWASILDQYPHDPSSSAEDLHCPPSPSPSQHLTCASFL